MITERVLLLLALSASAGTCYAALGETSSSIQTDRQKMRASARPGVANAQYTAHEMQTDAGTVVREYEAPNGVVFAVTWSGPVKPNLKQLLGAYYGRYIDASKANHTRHRHAEVNETNFVVRSHGHLRAFSGVAYLPPAVPIGVNIDDLQ